MLKQTIEILTSFLTPRRTCSMGNVALSRGAIEAGVSGVFSYPGTPSTEISEVFHYVNDFQNNPDHQLQYPLQTANKIYFEYSINEKIALEKAIAFSIGNKSALCVMKNVGMNVASDALMSITYQRIGAALVIIVCDDPGCHSSSNEQDSRHWGAMASVPVFNPATPDEAYSMIKQAFRLSEEIKLPVIIRTTTRVSHTRSIVSFGEINNENRPGKFERLPEHINIPARTAAAHNRLLEKLKSPHVFACHESTTKIAFPGNKARFGIICSGVAISYISELLYKHNYTDKIRVLSIGMIHPFPEKEVLNYLTAVDSPENILILEELDPLVENAVRIIAQKNNIQKKISGKGFSGLLSTGEFTIELLENVLEEFTELSFHENKNIPLENYEKYIQNLPPRPPALCAGCPHRATFYLLKLAIPRNQGDLILCGDIGCFGLGALPPLKMIDTINHMGMSISMAQGLFESLQSSTNGKKIVAMVGDGTFFHSGLISLVNAVYTRANILVVIFDNRTIGMTGHQSHPGASDLPKYQEIDIPPVLKGLGIDMVETINPFDIRASFRKLKEAMAHKGVSVIIAKSPCIFLNSFKEKINKKMQIAVDPTLCNSCANHEDHSLACSRCHSSENNLSRAKLKLMADFSIPGKDQLCPANICNHGFFHSIIEGDYKSAVEIVRDKMLFAHTCGNICHRPCENSTNGSRADAHEKNAVPIKAMKKFVAETDNNFRDFSIPVQRVKNAVKKNKSVAIIGAGPAGLSAAYDLVQWGYQVSIFEKENKAGGMIFHAIPDFRMDKNGFEYEAMQLEKLGVKFHFNNKLGEDFTIEKLSSEYDSVILAIGLSKSKTLDIVEKKIPSGKRTDALSFLRSYNRKENKIKNGSTILIIGGGNSAIDTARAAKKIYTGNKVIVSCIETEKAMPAFPEEVDHAINEGIDFIYCSYIESIDEEKQEKFKIILHSFDDKKHIRDVQCDFIITSIGQITGTGLSDHLFQDENTRVKCLDSFTGYKNVFAAGDIISGNNMSLIGAIASGKKAAIAVRTLLENYKFEYEGELALNRLNDLTLTKSNISDNSKEVEWDRFNLYQSCYKCNHCIDNFGCPAMVKVNGKVEIDLKRCNLCGLCIDVCPNNAIKWVVADELTN